MSLPSLFSGGVPLLFPSLTAAAVNNSLTYDDALNPTTARDDNMQSITVQYKIQAGGAVLPCLMRFTRVGVQITAYLISTTTLQFQLINRIVINIVPNEPLPLSWPRTFAAAEVANLGSSVVSNSSNAYQGFWNVSPEGSFAFTITAGTPPNGAYWFGTTNFLSQVAVGSWLSSTPSTTAPEGEIIAGTNIVVTPSGIDSIISTVTSPVFAGATIGGAQLPTAVGSSGQVLTVSSGSQLAWQNLPTGNTVAAGSNIVVTPVGSVATIALTASPAITGLTVADYTFPDAIGTTTQVLAVGAGGDLQWNDSGVTAVNQVNQNVLITPNGTGVDVELNNALNIDSLNANVLYAEALGVSSQYTFPYAIGTAGQVIAAQTGTGLLHWVDPAAGAITAVASTDANIAVAPGPEAILTLNRNLDLDQLNVAGVIAGAGTVVTPDAVTVTAPGGVSTVIGPGTVTAPTITVTGQYSLPAAIGTAGQILAVSAAAADNGGAVDAQGQDGPGAPTTEWITPVPQGVNSVTGDNEVIATTSPTGGNVSLSLAPVLNVGSVLGTGPVSGSTLGVRSQYTLPTTLGTVGDVIVVQSGTSQLAWAPNGGGSPGITAVVSTTDNIVAHPNGAEVQLTLSDNLDIVSVAATDGVATMTLEATGLTFETTSEGTTFISNQLITTPQLKIVNNADVVQYVLPATLGTSGQVLAAPASGVQTTWITPSSGGGVDTISAADSNITVGPLTAGNVAIGMANTINVGSANFTTASSHAFVVTGQYTLPETIGTPGQVMVVPGTGGQLAWETPASGGVTSVTGNSQITATPTSGAVELSLANTVVVEGIDATNLFGTRIEVTNEYTLPLTIGTSGQLLAVPITGSQLVWETPSSGGGVASVTGDANIVASPTTGEVVLSLGSTITVPTVDANSVATENLTVKGQYSFPVSAGLPAQVLTVPSSGTQLLWETPAATGVTSVTGDANIVATPTSGAVSLALSNALDVNSIEATSIGIKNQYFLPTTTGTPGQLLEVPISGDVLQWRSGGVTSVVGDAEVVATPGTNGEVTLSLGDAIVVDAITAAEISVVSQYTLPLTLGTTGQVITVQSGSTQLGWTTPASAGISDVVSTTANITTVPNGSEVELTLASNLNLESIAIAGSGSSANINASLVSIASPSTTSEINDSGIAVTAASGQSSTITTAAVASGSFVVKNVAGATQYSLPPFTGSTGQFLTVASGSTQLEWASETASGVITSTSSNLTVSPNGNDTELTVNPAQVLQSVLLETTPAATTNTTLTPSSLTLTAPSDSLAMSATQLAITTPAGTTTLTSIGISTQGVDIVDDLDSTVYTLPHTIGSADQVLTIPAVGNQLIWANPSSSGGISSVVSTTQPNLTANTAGSNVSLALSETLALQSVTCTLPLPGGNSVLNSQSLTVTNGSSSLTASSSIVELQSSSGRCTMAATGIECQQFVAIDSGGTALYALPNEAGTAGQVLTFGAECAWTTLPVAIESITSANANLVANTVANETTLTIASSQSLTQTTYTNSTNTIVVGGTSLVATAGANSSTLTAGGLTTPALHIGTHYSLPATIGTAGQALVVPVSGMQLTWATGGGSGGISEVVSANANIGVATALGEVTLTLGSALDVESIECVSGGNTATLVSSLLTITEGATGESIEADANSVNFSGGTLSTATLTSTALLYADINNSSSLNNESLVLARQALTSTTDGGGIVVERTDSAAVLSLQMVNETTPTLSLSTAGVELTTLTSNGLSCQSSISADSVSINSVAINYTSSQGYLPINSMPCAWATEVTTIYFSMGSTTLVVPTILQSCGGIVKCHMNFPSTSTEVVSGSNLDYISSTYTAVPSVAFCPNLTATTPDAVLMIADNIQVAEYGPPPTNTLLNIFSCSMFINAIGGPINYNLVFTMYINPSLATPSPQFTPGSRFIFNYYPQQVGNNTATWWYCTF